MANHDATKPHVQHDATDHEASDVNVRAILAFVVVLFATAVVVHVAIWGLFVFFERNLERTTPMEYPLSVSQGSRVPPEPRLQTTPREDLRELRVEEDQRLQSYGWVDRNGGVVHIPIDEAMRLTIERGLPARSEATR